MTIKSSEERRAVLQISAKLDKMDPEILARVLKSVAHMFGYVLLSDSMDPSVTTGPAA